MITDFGSFTLVVRSQEEALAYYTEVLGFEKRADMPMGETQRWLTVAPRDARVELVLQPLDWFEGNDRVQVEKRIGNSPTIVFKVDNCHETCATLSERGVEFVEYATEVPWGVQAVFKDLYGNQLVLLERSW